MERRLKEAELLKARLEKENDNLRAKNAKLRKSLDLIMQLTVQFQEQGRDQVLRLSLRSLKIGLLILTRQLKIHLLSQRQVVVIGASHLVRKPSKALRLSLKKNEKEASKSKGVPNGKTKVTVTDSSAKVGPKSTPSSERKKRIIIAGDSIVKDIRGWLMSRQKSFKVYSFSGADTKDMEHFLQPLINKKPDIAHCTLHIGTNDVSNGVTVKQATDQIMTLC